MHRHGTRFLIMACISRIFGRAVAVTPFPPWQAALIPRIINNVLATLAQLVEHLIRNERVVGSNPISGSKSKRAMISVALFLSVCQGAVTKWAFRLILNYSPLCITTDWNRYPFYQINRYYSLKFYIFKIPLQISHIFLKSRSMIISEKDSHTFRPVGDERRRTYVAGYSWLL